MRLPLGGFTFSHQPESTPLFAYQSLLVCPEIAQRGSCCIYFLSYITLYCSQIFQHRCIFKYRFPWHCKWCRHCRGREPPKWAVELGAGAKWNTQGNYFLQRYSEKPWQNPQCAELCSWSCCGGQRVGCIREAWGCRSCTKVGFAGRFSHTLHCHGLRSL